MTKGCGIPFLRYSSTSRIRPTGIQTVAISSTVDCRVTVSSPNFILRYSVGSSPFSIGDSFHSPSGDLNSVIVLRYSRFRSFTEIFSGRITPCSPIVQLKGRVSLPTLSDSKSKPSMNASGRGGHPGTYTSTGRNLSTPCTTLYMSYIPPELAHDPMEITHLGSIICS